MAEVSDVVRARAWLCRCAEPGSARLYRFVSEYGPVAAMQRIQSGDIPQQLQRIVAARRGVDMADHDLGVAERQGVRFITPEDDEWPREAFRTADLLTTQGIEDCAPPLGLWVRGSLRLSNATEQAVAVVGARAATSYGTHVGTEIAYALASRGWTVISGGAVGIDTAAHLGALACEGATIAVLAGCVSSPYPGERQTMFTRVSHVGLLVSEWPIGSQPLRHRFLIRNRTIAAMASGVVVVEAAARSGAASTARRASELGKPVMAVPGPVTSAMSVGTHHLIREYGARLVINADQIVEEVASIGESFAPKVSGPEHFTDKLDYRSRIVFDAIPFRGAVSPEEIAFTAGIPLSEVLQVLPALECQELLELSPEGWRLSATAKRKCRSAPTCRVR